MVEMTTELAATGVGPWSTVASTLADFGIRRVFGLPDDDMRAQRALEQVGIALDWTVSQRTAVHMAAGEALAKAAPSVCVIGRGPAVAAAVPGLLEASSGHAPVVVLAAGTASERLETRAFQDAPTLDLVRPVTTWAARVPSAELVGPMLRSAFARAATAPAGPVYLEIPDDNPGATCGISRYSEVIADSKAQELLRRAERPVVLLGGGARSVQRETLQAVVESLDAAVLVTASGRGRFAESSPNFLGVAGLYMAPDVTSLVATADLVVTIGSRLEETAITNMPMDTTWLQFNIAVQDVAHWVGGFHQVRDGSDMVALLEPIEPLTNRDQWRAAWATTRSRLYAEVDANTTSLCAAALRDLSDVLPDDVVVVHENGLHDMWSYGFPYFPLPDGATCVAPSEQTTMGFGVAAAAGIAQERGRLVVCLTGDTALRSMASDLSDRLRRHARLLYVVFDDGGLGWLDQQAQSMGSTANFLGISGVDDAPIPASSLLDVTDPRFLRTVLTDSVSRALLGQATVVRVHCERDDVLPWLSEHGPELTCPN